MAVSAGSPPLIDVAAFELGAFDLYANCESMSAVLTDVPDDGFDYLVSSTLTQQTNIPL